MEPFRQNQLLKIIVGTRYGENPLEHLEAIQAEKTAQARQLLASFPVQASDQVMDLGCGAGWAAPVVAPQAATYIGVDTEKDFISLAEKEFKEAAPGLEFHTIPYGDLSAFRERGLTKVFASDVMTQFNLFDLAVYLKEVRALLNPGGLFYFNFLNADLLDPSENPKFSRHLSAYLRKRSDILNLMQWHSARTITTFARSAGFQIEHLNEGDFAWVILRAAEGGPFRSDSSPSSAGSAR